MTVKCGLLGDPVQHYDGCIGRVASAPGFVFDCDIPISAVEEAVDGHISSDHPTNCKITTGASVMFIDDRPAALHGSEVSCDGYVVAQAQVTYTD